MPAASPIRRVLLIISGDPRASHRPAEALRVAAGLRAWGQVELQVCLRGDAWRLLAETPGELVDEEEIARCLPVVSREPGLFLVGTPAGLGPLPEGTRVASLEEMAALVDHSHIVLNF